jgi:hypothetical protein
MGKSNIANIHTSYSAARDYGIKFYSFIYDEELLFYGSIKNLENKLDIENNPTAVFGRQDPIMTFSRVGRSIDLTFYVPSATFSDAEFALHDLNRLIQYQYPAFKRTGQANTISASPLLKLKVANLIYDNAGAANGTAKDSGLVIAMTSLSHKFDFEGNTAWSDEYNKMIPMGFEVSLSAVVLHSHALGSESGQSAFPDPDNYPYGGDVTGWANRPAPQGDSMPFEPAPTSGPVMGPAQDDGGLFGPFSPSYIPGMSSTTPTSDITGE